MNKEEIINKGKEIAKEAAARGREFFEDNRKTLTPYIVGICVGLLLPIILKNR